MIKNSEPLSMAESLEYIKSEEESETKIVDFIKKFSKLNPKDAKELRQQIDSFGIIKVIPEYSVKIVDLLPETVEELNKIFVDIILEDDEANKILEAVKKFK
jgi:DNA-directed RNA polymerase subunit F